MRSTSPAWPNESVRSATHVPGPPSPVDDTRAAALAVLRLAAVLEPDPVAAMAWYCSVPLAVLDGCTASELVRAGRVHAVLGFLRATIAVDRAERRTLQ
ncbi:hypothetical protein J7I44_16590 [Frateuria sp. MAH-13]|uniref:DUF2384 domain-containing protein n=1 Tax=Frateuria flava TaxID=2821489 RepID=A0ABS4DSG1_9GAMM|nr:hypothetical protein [Frateuria flava]MBP1475918.1 hypothetical protein [Frateuria flava]